MQDDLIALLAGRRGHFRMESGFHTETWFNLDVLFADTARLMPFVRELTRLLVPYRAEVVCGPATGGAKLAKLVAAELGCISCPAERHEPAASAELSPVEYRIPAARRDDLHGRTAVIVDDAISAGSAIKGTYSALLACGARPVACGALIVFGDAADGIAAGRNLGLASVARTAFAMWRPADCPLCRSGIPVVPMSDATP